MTKRSIDWAKHNRQHKANTDPVHHDNPAIFGPPRRIVATEARTSRSHFGRVSTFLLLELECGHKRLVARLPKVETILCPKCGDAAKGQP